MPEGMDLVAVFNASGDNDEPRRALGSASGLLGDLGLMRQTLRSWTELSRTLGYSEAEAGEALLGGRIVVGWRGPAGLGVNDLDAGGFFGALNAADTGWLLIAPVPEPTARRISSRLDAVPRRISGGHAVYTVDSGRTGMAVVRHGETWRLIVSPTSNADLLDACLARLRAGEPDHARSEAAMGLLGDVNPGWSALMLAYPRDIEGAIALSLRGSRGTWTMGFAGRADARHGAPVGLLGEIGGDALVAIASAGDPLEHDGSLSIGIDLIGNTLNQIAPPSRRVHFDTGCALALTGDSDGSTLTALVTARGRSDASFAQAADQAIAELIADPHNQPLYRGLFPDAVRTHTVEGSEGWPGDRTRVAWCLGPDADDRSGVVALAIGSDARVSSATARHGREAWSRLADVVEDDAVSVGYARPARLAEALGMGGDPVSMLARQFDRVSWDIRQQAGVVRGTVTLRISPTKARLGAD